MPARSTILVVTIGLVFFAEQSHSIAGMPSPLPTNWTKDHTPEWISQGGSINDSSMDARFQAISFFGGFLLASALGIKWLWNVLRRDLTWLPVVGYRQALCMTTLWGLLFVIVLTMISGARELMTPGAWRKQGWTYKLVKAPAVDSLSWDARNVRRQSLERLRLTLMTWAATHQGRFPARDDPSLEATLWDLPGWPGIHFQLVPNREASQAAQLLVFEPDVEGDERQVILTNGMIGTMQSSQIREALSERNSQ